MKYNKYIYREREREGERYLFLNSASVTLTKRGGTYEFKHWRQNSIYMLIENGKPYVKDILKIQFKGPSKIKRYKDMFTSNFKGTY